MSWIEIPNSLYLHRSHKNKYKLNTFKPKTKKNLPLQTV